MNRVLNGHRHSFRSLGLILLTALVACRPHAGHRTDFQIPTLQRNESVHRPRPTEQNERVQSVLDALYRSELGRDFLLYLEGGYENQSQVLSSDLVNRIFADGGRSITAISALSLMVQDLEARKGLTEDQMHRLLVLHLDINQRQVDSASYPGEGLAYALAIGVIAALPFGYPPVRHTLKYVIAYIGERLGFKAATGATPVLMEGWNTYSIVYPVKKFFQVFGPFSLLYFFWFDWKESARGHSVVTYIQNLPDEKSFESFLNDLRHL